MVITVVLTEPLYAFPYTEYFFPIRNVAVNMWVETYSGWQLGWSWQSWGDSPTFECWS